MLDRSQLVEFLGLVSDHLREPVTLVAAGGTALTLLDLKASTLDIDFTGPKPSIDAFRQALRQEPHGYKIDLWDDGWVFATGLPADYLDRSILVERLPNIPSGGINLEEKAGANVWQGPAQNGAFRPQPGALWTGGDAGEMSALNSEMSVIIRNERVLIYSGRGSRRRAPAPGAG